MDFMNGEIRSHLFVIFCHVFGFKVCEKAEYFVAINKLKKSLETLDKYLTGKKFFVGGDVTLADLACVCFLQPIFGYVFGEKDREQFKALTALMTLISALPEVVKICGAFKLNKVSMKVTFEDIKKERKESKDQKNEKKEKKDEKKDKKDKKDDKKEKKDEKKPKKNEEEDDEVKTEKEPLDALPPSPYSLDKFKFDFLASPNKREYLQKNFYSQLDLNGYCIYYLSYIKDADDCKVLYKTSNLMGGFIQRVEQKGRYGFGVHTILGVEGNYEVRGVWMFRGTTVPKFMVDHICFEFYKNKKLDITKEEDKKLIEDYWCANEGELIEGLKYEEGKYFR